MLRGGECLGVIIVSVDINVSEAVKMKAYGENGEIRQDGRQRPSRAFQSPLWKHLQKSKM